ncbi:MAG: molybdenum cofactor guanylyltransferase [Desulfurococcales archaeon]|nr:molybdenum cofactor guanylyltransferase [Desulfurococcales archaeon]
MLALILAGGASRRFGEPKALARVGGRTFLERVYTAISSVAGEVIVAVTDYTPRRAVDLARSLGAEVMSDDPSLPCLGPPRAVVTVYQELRPEELLVAGVDYPFLDGSAVESIVELARKSSLDALTPMLHPGYPLVTLGYLASPALEALEEACVAKRGLVRLTDAYRGAPRSAVSGWSIHAEDARILQNVNRREDLEEAPSPPVLRVVVRVPSTAYREAIEALELGDYRSAAGLFGLESLLHEERGLRLYSIHASKDERWARSDPRLEAF